MSFNERIYRGKRSLYSNVVTDQSDKDKLLIFSSAWGEPNANKIAIDTVREYFLSAKTDQDYTSPYPLSKDISLTANHLKIGVMLANEKVYKEFNQEEYTCGIELMAMAISNRELSIAHIGGPNIIMQKNGIGPITCINNQHLGFEFKSSKNYPLPKDLLGIHIKHNVKTQSYRLNQNDELYLIYADYAPQISQKDNLEKIEKKLQKESERPYWIAKWSPFT